MTNNLISVFVLASCHWHLMVLEGRKRRNFLFLANTQCFSNINSWNTKLPGLGILYPQFSLLFLRNIWKLFIPMTQDACLNGIAWPCSKSVFITVKNLNISPHFIERWNSGLDNKKFQSQEENLSRPAVELMFLQRQHGTNWKQEEDEHTDVAVLQFQPCWASSGLKTATQGPSETSKFGSYTSWQWTTQAKGHSTRTF